MSLALLCLLLALASTNAVNNCRSLCKARDSGLFSICRPAISIDPRPRVYRSCQKGRQLGFEHACTATCEATSFNSSDVSEGTYSFSPNAIEPRALESCGMTKTRGKGSIILTWCRKGYEQAFEETRKMIANNDTFWTSPDDEGNNDETQSVESIEDNITSADDEIPSLTETIEASPEPTIEQEYGGKQRQAEEVSKPLIGNVIEDQAEPETAEIEIDHINNEDSIDLLVQIENKPRQDDEEIEVDVVPGTQNERDDAHSIPVEMELPTTQEASNTSDTDIVDEPASYVAVDRERVPLEDL